MEKWLKRLTIICLIILTCMALYSIYKDFVLPRLYNKNTSAAVLDDYEVYDYCNNAVIKYFDSIRDNINNISHFIPYGKKNSSKIKRYGDILKGYSQIRTYKAYKINNSTYKIEYSIFDDSQEKYIMVLKFYKKRNYYKVLYDQLYEEGRIG